VIIGTTSIRLSEDNHDSWVMSGMDPHKISGSPGFGWFGLVGLVWFGLVGLSKWILLGCGSVTVRLRDAIEVRTLRRCCDLSTSTPKA
jgi:hypothetical protein